MRQLREIAADFLAYRSVERAELLALHRAELVEPVYTTDPEFARLERLLGVNTRDTVFYGLKVLPKH